MKRFSFLVFLLVFLTLGCAHSPSPAPSQSSSPSAPPSQPGVVLAVSSSEAFKTKIGFEACLTSPYFHDSWCHAPKGGAWRLRPKSSEVSGIDGRTEDRKNLKESSKAEDEAAADPPESFKSSPESSAQSGTESAEGQEDFEDGPQGEEKEITAIPDPLEPFNRAMFHFNDKLYFWVLKPVAQGYNKVVPEPARVGVKNFFSNLGFPARFVSCLLQADFKGAATQLGRFVVNTVWGVGGLLDPSSSEQLNIPKQDADLGQTLGIYGLGQGFYIVWPFLGPSSARDSVNIGGDYFLAPVSYINPWYDGLAVRAYGVLNTTSLNIGDYESLKEAAIDPYVAVRDAYHQYRQKKVEAGKDKPKTPKTGGVQ